MTVRELINSLLDKPMDAVVVGYNSEGYKLEDLSEEAKLFTTDFGGGSFVTVMETDYVGKGKNERTGEKEKVVIIW